MWEDKANKDGGRWMATIDKKTPSEKLDHYWLELVMFMIDKRFVDHEDIVNGAAINIRAKGNKISLWTKNCDNTNGGMISLGLKMKQVLGFSPTQIVVFHSHHAIAKSTSQEQTKVTYYI
uniref:Eukaryotic translation initiation factor 4E n=1 Tax=Lygus hesperus TaxID=30085 RepID=A0A0A9X949_LYGHE